MFRKIAERTNKKTLLCHSANKPPIFACGVLAVNPAITAKHADTESGAFALYNVQYRFCHPVMVMST